MVAPTVNVSNIRPNCQLETGFLIGTADDGPGTIAAVEVQFDGGAYAPATGTVNWKMAIPSGASTWKNGSEHTLSVRSRDTEGNYSTVVSTAIRKATNKDVNGDGYADLGVGDPEYSSTTGRAYLYYGSVSGILSSPAADITGEAVNNNFGHTMTFGDLNGDGYADFIIGSMYHDPSMFWGKVHIFYGSSTGIAAANADAADFILLSKEDAYWSFSSSLATGDANNDGYDDLAVGNYDMGIDSRVHIFNGGPSGISGTSPKRAGLADTVILGNFIGASIAFGDVNGDGYEDVAIGAQYPNEYTGQVYIVYGTVSGIPGDDVTLIQNTTIFNGEATYNKLGRSVSVGDINRDGYADIAIGAHGFNGDQGRVYIYHGSSGYIPSPANVAASANLVLDGSASSMQGWLVAMGDVNSDGYMDLGISARAYNSNQGRAFIYLGSGGGLITPSDKTYTGAATYYLAYAIGFADLNGDGYTDFIASAPNYERFLVYNGSSTGTSTMESVTVSGLPLSPSWYGSSLTLNAGPIW